jgi:hypothetical protein
MYGGVEIDHHPSPRTAPLDIESLEHAASDDGPTALAVNRDNEGGRELFNNKNRHQQHKE